MGVVFLCVIFRSILCRLIFHNPKKTVVFEELQSFITDSITNNNIKPNIPVMMTIILHSHQMCMESTTCTALVYEFIKRHPEVQAKLALMAA